MVNGCCCYRNNAIADYLLTQGFTDTLDAFKREADVVSCDWWYLSNSGHLYLIRKMLARLDIMDYWRRNGRQL